MSDRNKNTVLVSLGCAMAFSGMGLLFTGHFWLGVILAILGVIIGFTGAIIFKPA